MEDNPRIRYCSRCKESVPISEWNMSLAENGNIAWEHRGIDRRAIVDDPQFPRDPGHERDSVADYYRCGFIESRPDRYAKEAR